MQSLMLCVGAPNSEQQILGAKRKERDREIDLNKSSAHLHMENVQIKSITGW